jgi:hypothetical protein
VIEVYCYVWTTLDTRIAYATIFEHTFRCLSDAARVPIHFGHIHNGAGIQTVTLDMCPKQAPGFGDHLHTLDNKLEWNEHLQHMLVFCKIHVRRNFLKKFRKHALTHHFEKIFSSENSLEIAQHMHGMCEVHPELKTWFSAKQNPWILAGLSREQSKVDIRWWLLARKDTNISESSHHQDNYSTGINLSLLASVLR